MDWFDLAAHGDSTINALSKINIKKALVLGVKTDILFPPQQQKEIAEGLSQADVKVDFKNLDSIQGHDSFLVDTETFSHEIKNFINNL